MLVRGGRSNATYNVPSTADLRFLSRFGTVWKFFTLLYLSIGYQNHELRRSEWIGHNLNMELEYVICLRAHRSDPAK